MTVAKAVVPSWPTVLARNGPTALATRVPPPRPATAFSTASRFPAAVAFSPPGAMKTTLAVAPSAVAPGKRCSIRSNAFRDSMPGIENSSSTAPGALREPAQPHGGQDGRPDQGDVPAAPEGQTAHSIQSGSSRRRAPADTLRH
ncbi:hypothetical protein BJ965_003651 [Streptomyces luteogriseus]|uniref:Uncharacterized protein n=1 Tax=Streptomyces luteogriseus TaxID=68233 RepID=A0A7W7DN09_9ACTN|nr:hypothetical protein [Streptomyces luteogriseus]